MSFPIIIPPTKYIHSHTFEVLSFDYTMSNTNCAVGHCTNAQKAVFTQRAATKVNTTQRKTPILAPVYGRIRFNVHQIPYRILRTIVHYATRASDTRLGGEGGRGGFGRTSGREVDTANDAPTVVLGQKGEWCHGGFKNNPW